MRGLIVLLAYMSPIIAAWIGYLLGSISRPDRKELKAATALIDDLTIKASEHATLGSDFAVITLGDINLYRRKANQ